VPPFDLTGTGDVEADADMAEAKSLSISWFEIGENGILREPPSNLDSMSTTQGDLTLLLLGDPEGLN